MTAAKARWFVWGRCAHTPGLAFYEPSTKRDGKALCGVKIPRGSLVADFPEDMCDTCLRLWRDAEVEIERNETLRWLRGEVSSDPIREHGHLVSENEAAAKRGRERGKHE